MGGLEWGVGFLLLIGWNLFWERRLWAALTLMGRKLVD